MTDTKLGVPGPLPARNKAKVIPLLPLLSRNPNETLINQLVRSVAACVDGKLLRRGTRMPSIRQFAGMHGVSCATVVASYDKLVAKGYLESRRGAGFFVRERSLSAADECPPAAPVPPELTESKVDVIWLVRSMIRQAAHHSMPGAGVLPADWMDGASVGNALRDISRQNHNLLINYGIPQGFLPLRQQLQHKLEELEISATAEQIVTTVGVTHGLDLVAREFLQPGDTVFVDDPAWFLLFGAFSVMGAKVVGIPRLANGPDIAQLAELAALHKPKLYVINSVLHNPTSTSLSAGKAFQILRIAEEHNITIVEDDIYCDLHDSRNGEPATRLAALDQLQRVIYLGGFSKTLAGNLRVGFIATSPENAQRLTDRKMLSTLTISDIGEKVVYKILSEGLYRRHIDRIRARLDTLRMRTVRQMERVGLSIDTVMPSGMFVWADAGRDTNLLTQRAAAEGILLAPGALFSSRQLPSSRMRMNLSTMQNPAIWRFFERELAGR